MPTWSFVLLVVVLWLLIGLGAALLLLGRHGHHSGSWYVLGAVLGPLFVPIAVERGRRTNQVLERTAGTAGPAPAVTVVVGVDGSAESDQAVRDAARLFAPAGARFVLAAVADPDVAEFGEDAGVPGWHEVLADRAGWLPADGPAPVLEVLCGQPDLVLLQTAEDEGADVLVVGHRGRGLSHLLLGSVAESLTRRAAIPVLLAGPARGHRSLPPGDARGAVRSRPSL